MKHLQWFPGHMTAAMRMMEESLKLVDGVIIVLDARCPRASINKKLDKLFINKKVLYVLNKSDLIEKKDAVKTVSEFKNEGRVAISASANDKKSVDFLYQSVLELLKDKIEKNRERGVNKPMRVMVAGIPNTGKSTIINALAGGKKTVTGNKAGVTRGKQWVKIGEIELLDTPGTMPPAFDDQTLAKHLAYVGSMNDANIDFKDLAAEFISELIEKYPETLKEKYGLESIDSVPEVFDGICERRGFVKKGGIYDYDRCSVAVIDDFRKGRTGKIILD
ncbi:MAG: ribosome biogenesis GTPase YlqF [Clostridia bacterium]|nr:ribosome biogenesis GTPase YlqF [Clostridia bacterium]